MLSLFSAYLRHHHQWMKWAFCPNLHPGRQAPLTYLPLWFGGQDWTAGLSSLKCTDALWRERERERESRDRRERERDLWERKNRGGKREEREREGEEHRKTTGGETERGNREEKRWGDRDGMRKKVLIILILMDIGATHNLLSTKIIEEFHILVTQSMCFEIVIGNGSTAKGQGICMQCAGWHSGIKIVEEFLPV